MLADNKTMQQLIDLGIQARNEKIHLVHMADLLASKPQNMKLTKIEIDEKKVMIEGYSIDTNTFKEYTESKKEERFFSNMKVEKIAAAGNNSPYKICTITATTEPVGDSK